MAHLQPSWGVKAKRSLISWHSTSNRGDLKFSSLSQTSGGISPLREKDDNREDTCTWCGRGGISESGVRGHVDGNGAGQQKCFCSDVCFSQCRRAAFKRAKVCDWCKHVRHTVTYVDLNDGQRQLQFCTDKCRNQYKMQLFCAEATSLGVQSCASSELGGTSTAALIDQGKSTPELLITPELWLADCRDGDSTSVKAECSDEGEVGSNGSDQEDRNSVGDVPLNLVHSSRQSGCISKKRHTTPELRDSHQVASKKGKSHRKPNSTLANKVITHKQAEINGPLHPISHLPPHLANNIWPAFPYSPNLPPHPSYFLQSHLFSLNQSVKPINTSASLQDDCNVSQGTLDEGGATEKEENISIKAQQLEKRTEGQRDEGSLIKESAEKGADSFTSKTELLLPENIVVLRIPTLVPLPIPIPIPIPLNIHEKYLKQMLT